jgi:hypothetical protein
MTSTPPKVPPILPTAAQAKPKPPNNPPPKPSSRPQQVQKRAAPEAPAMSPPPKKPKHQPAAGDWKCKKCGWWNQRIWTSCHRLPRAGKEPCAAKKNDNTLQHLVQEETEDVKIQKSHAKWFEDWRCGPCKKWNDCCRKTSRICDVLKEECQDAEERMDKDLDLPPWFYSQNSSKDYWYGESQGPTAPRGSQHSEHAAYLGVKGQFKKKKSGYRES